MAASRYNNNLTQNQNEFQTPARNLLGNSSANKFSNESIPYAYRKKELNHVIQSC